MIRPAIIASLAITLLAGCQSGPPGGIDPAYQIVDRSMEGNWTTANGTKVEIEALGNRAFEAEFDDGKTEATYQGHLLSINGKKFIEISLFQPDRRSEIPVYHYALVEEIGETITHRPLRPEWLAEASKSMPDAIYRSTAQEQPGSGGLVVRDNAAMLEVLKKAASDPGAFGPAEKLARVKSN